MHTFTTFATYIASPFSPDNWEDSGIEYAEKLLQGFTVDDWTYLQTYWHDYPTDWQQRCAQVLPWGDATQAVPLLVTMLHSADDDLLLAVVDALRAFDTTLIAAALTPEAKQKITALGDRSTGIAHRVITDLLTQIGKP